LAKEVSRLGIHPDRIDQLLDLFKDLIMSGVGSNDGGRRSLHRAAPPRARQAAVRTVVEPERAFAQTRRDTRSQPEGRRVSCTSTAGPSRITSRTLAHSTRCHARSPTVVRRDGRPATLVVMQLRTARLCLDCEEIHDGQECPRCASETFAYISRWVPAPERRTGQARPPLEPSPDAAVYRQLMVADAVRPKAGRLLKRGAVGLAAISLARWMWRRWSSISHGEEPEPGPRRHPPKAPDGPGV
jgi:hypothetical protein